MIGRRDIIINRNDDFFSVITFVRKKLEWRRPLLLLLLFMVIMLLPPVRVLSHGSDSTI
jgi:hypothetical protein